MCPVADMLLLNLCWAYLTMTSLSLRIHFDKNDGLPFWVYDLAECTLLPGPIVPTIPKRITKVYIQRSILNTRRIALSLGLLFWNKQSGIKRWYLPLFFFFFFLNFHPTWNAIPRHFQIANIFRTRIKQSFL